MKNKKLILSIIFLIIFLVCFWIIYYNFYKSGNNNFKKLENRTVKEIINNYKSYYAEEKVTIISNKTENVYEAKEYVDEEKSYLESLDGKFKIENKDGIIRISNFNNINTKEYKIENKYNNNLFFITSIKNIESLIKDDASKIQINEDENIVIIKFKDTYGIRKEIYYDKTKKILIKMNILNDVQNIKICIEYKYIELKNNK